MLVGILGGTGPAGGGLAARLACAGVDVVVGSRRLEKAQEAVDAINSRWADRGLELRPGDNAAAAGAEIVVVATPWDAAVPTALSVSGGLDGKVVVCMANALTRVGQEFQALVPARGSVAATLQAAVPGAMVAAAFQHLPAKELSELGHPLDSDVLVCADHEEARRATADLVRCIPDLRPLDAGSLASAGPVEALTAVLLQLNARYRTRAAVRFTGIDA